MICWIKKKLFDKEPMVPEVLQQGLVKIGPFMAHRKTGFDLSFMDKEWYEKDMSEEFTVVGHHHSVISADPSHVVPRPRDGYTFVVEMKSSWVLFVMKDVRWQTDPSEMYFATAMFLEQKRK